MKKLQKLFLVGIVSSLLMQNTFAWGGEIDYSTSPLNNIADLVKNSETKKIISNNIASIINNNIQEEYNYNNYHFYTKKLILDIGIPELLKNKIQKAYIAFSTQSNPGEIIITKNIKKIDNTSEFARTIVLDKEIFDKYLSNDYGDSFLWTFYIVLNDGTVLPFSNSLYLYIPGNIADGKLQIISNIYAQKNSFYSPVPIIDLLQKIFLKFQEGKTGNEYIAILEKAIEKIDGKIKPIEEERTKIANSIQKEEDFTKFINFWATIERYNTFNEIRSNIGWEIRAKQNEWLIDEIFSNK